MACRTCPTSSVDAIVTSIYLVSALKPAHDDSSPRLSRPWRAGPVTLAELSAGLAWPLLLRAPVLALRPSRVLMGVHIMLILWGASALLDWLLGLASQTEIGAPLVWSVRDAWMNASAQFVGLHPVHAIGSLHTGTSGRLFVLLSDRPFITSIALLVLAPALAIGTGAISRSVAVDVAAGLNMGMRESLTFALRRWRGLTMAVLIPLIVVACGVFALMAGGWLLLGFPGLNILGALLYGVFLVISLAVVVLLAGLLFGHSMLAPAVAVEGTDSADAVQRVYAYLLGRPGRAFLYVGTAVVQGLIALGIVAWIVNGAADLTASMSGAMLPPERASTLFEVGRQTGAAGSIIMFWQLLVSLLLSGVLISWYATAGTLLYLLLRRVCDEQDVREVWMPGVIDGTGAAEREAAVQST